MLTHSNGVMERRKKRQKVVCFSGKTGIYEFFCTFVELWVDLILGN